MDPQEGLCCPRPSFKTTPFLTGVYCNNSFLVVYELRVMSFHTKTDLKRIFCLPHLSNVILRKSVNEGTD